MPGGAASAGSQDAWPRLLALLAGLRGDLKLESFLSEKHPELLELLSATGGPRPTPEDSEEVQRWFQRKLRGRGGLQERAALCEKMTRKVLHRAEGWESDVGRIEEALAQNSADEGPLVCRALAKELQGSRFEGIWISREGPGVYRLGEAQLRVAIQVLEGKLLVHGYFEGAQLHPVRVAIRPFLAEHGPAEMRSATDECDLFGGVRCPDPAPGERPRSRSPRSERKQSNELPAGWVKKESRSKPGVFYFANEAKGLTQFDMPVL
mmetsp:Transcript_70932/g.154105  ORF Transcript_70932/g.154105 Transcript_70932/m.154105 type:complete len:265 (+) Transcript_70932:167-961(+)|eukprot:CAMPEP_0170577854 /NCGR_PEP_ID=MMETSP0224-20130122/5147_1 /TAXON_ID=285029 /ORGANISM="Togula jolla, Strain CCCM 725" /LENGTH=264 /DNA_ID=CAMNT_0010900789 /DNA_START=103 /DNA_END=897 /DNA_ORIENTATION=-